MTDDTGYSSEDDKAYALKQRRLKSNRIKRQEAKQYEPRRYTQRDQDFARRFNRGVAHFGGDS